MTMRSFQQIQTVCSNLPPLLMKHLNIRDVPVSDMNIDSVWFVRFNLGYYADILVNICGADGKGKNGYRAAEDGKWQHYYWLEGTDCKGIRFVIDVKTKPGFPVSIEVLTHSKVSFQYVCGDQHIVQNNSILYAKKESNKRLLDDVTTTSIPH